jgi:hypothetical protein
MLLQFHCKKIIYELAVSTPETVLVEDCDVAV